jgi:hypothetical protein
LNVAPLAYNFLEDLRMEIQVACPHEIDLIDALLNHEPAGKYREQRSN